MSIEFIEAAPRLLSKFDARELLAFSKEGLEWAALSRLIAICHARSESVSFAGWNHAGRDMARKWFNFSVDPGVHPTR